MDNERSTVYLDVDDDITSILGKLHEAEHNHVALVVPKRSTVLQSVVNMKLIKKAAKEAGKRPILITEDIIVSNIAGGQAMLVASNLQAEPKVPPVDKIAQTSLPSDVIEGEPLEAASPSPLASKAEQVKDEPEQPTQQQPSARQQSKGEGAKSKRIPDFDRFKKRFILAGLALIGGGILLWLLLIAWPKASIVVDGRTEPVDVAFNFTADSKVEKPEYNNSLLPAQAHSISKTLSKTITPTGKKDVGTKAKGSVSIENCETGGSKSYSAGVTFTSSTGKAFTSDSGFTVPGAGVSGGNVVCGQSEEIPVTAAANGDNYNIEPTSYSSPTFSGDYEITGSKMSGGTSKTITVVTKSDITAAQKELVGNERAGAREELENQFKDDEHLIEPTFKEDIKKVESDPAAGQEASSARVTVEVEYSQIAIKDEYLNELIVREGKDQQKPEAANSLTIVDGGLEGAEFKLQSTLSSSTYRLAITTEALLGPDINFDELKEKIMGKKRGEVAEIVKTYPNVSGADVKLSPFYIRKVPTDPNKINIEIKLPSQQ